MPDYHIGKPTIIEISDGLDGNTIDMKTVQFGFENVSYEIDLGPKLLATLLKLSLLTRRWLASRADVDVGDDFEGQRVASET
jgi:hypothetical protein